jgi:F0F1-type ATP synthase membrane subunit b/b'
MTSWLAVTSQVNWVDLIHYPHFGGPSSGPYVGPPVVFVLLDFALFLWLCRRFLWPVLLRMAQEERRKFQEEEAEALNREAEAARIAANVRELEETWDQRRQAIADQTRQEMTIEREGILGKALAYQTMRRNETLKQVLIKRDLMVRQIRDELLVESLQRVRALLPRTSTRPRAASVPAGATPTFERRSAVNAELISSLLRPAP